MEKWTINISCLIALIIVLLSLSSCIETKKIPPQIMNEANQASLPADQENHPLALKFLPTTKKGYTDWVAAIQHGIIKPKEKLVFGEKRLMEEEQKRTMPVIDFDIFFRVKGEVPDVKFPHKPHTQWLDCRNCHPSIFLMKAGANPITMEKIFEGEFCGRCHGSVAFSLTDCTRCHSIPK